MKLSSKELMIEAIIMATTHRRLQDELDRDQRTVAKIHEQDGTAAKGAEAVARGARPGLCR